MQLDNTKEDEERQEAIAAEFETNTDELRLKRLEDRLDLLQRLDETRISVVEAPTAATAATKPKTEETSQKDDANANAVDNNNREKEGASSESSSSSEEESSSDEEDCLVIVGMKKPFKPLKPLHNYLPSRGLQLLNEINSPKNKKTRRSKQLAATTTTTTTNSNTNKKDGDSATATAAMILSPGRSMVALRNALKQKQRKQGNRWLARELGYKTEEDHLKDCKTQPLRTKSVEW